MYEIFEKLMTDRGVKAIDVSNATGIRPSVFTDWKKGRSAPKIDKLKKIAEFFDVPVEYLQTGEMPTGYYFDGEVARLAQDIMQSKELRLLFSEARSAAPEDIKTTYDMLLALKRKERHDD